VEPFSPSLQVPIVVQPTPRIPELQPLPNNLKYLYLEDEERLSIIICISLTIDEEYRLLQIFRKHKKAIGQTLTNILDISPSKRARTGYT